MDGTDQGAAPVLPTHGDVSAESGVMGSDRNTVHLVTARGVESWPQQSKEEVARALVARIGETLAGATR